MGIAERLALAPSESDLGWADNATKPVEFVAALAATTNLGSDMHRAKDKDASALRRGALLLAKKAMDKGRRLRLPLSRAQAQLMAVAVLIEHCQPHCRVCHGARQSVVDSLKVICSACGGVGVHRYSDKERAIACGIKPADWPKWERRYRMVMAIALEHDTAQRDASIRLGE